MLLKETIAEDRMASPDVLWLIVSFPLVLCCIPHIIPLLSAILPVRLINL